MEFVQIPVNERPELGSAAVRRLRRDGRVPAVLYGLKRRNLSLTLPLADLEKFLGSGSHLVELTMGDESRDAILRDVQYDPLSEQILHVDFQRVEKGVKIEDQVPVVYKGIAAGTREGGLFQSLIGTLGVRARPRDLPGEILLDISELHVTEGIRIKDLPALEGVEFLHEPDDVICQVVAVRGGDDVESAEGEGEEGAEGAAEPATSEG